MQLTKTYLLLLFLAMTVLIVNALAMFAPMLTSGFGPYYASIAKNMLTYHSWSKLIFLNQPWLDKPHFPFWATAISFKLLSISSYAYILPGFIFYVLGVIYTYLLAKLLYENKQIAVVAVLIMVSSLHLLLSSIDVRAEAYLIGQIMPACYYWLLYDRTQKLKYLFLGALFSAMALMTKGLFVVITIFSGLAICWIVTGRLTNLFKPKWLVAFSLSLVLVLPEIIALYAQFGGAGIKWYLWGSQFGRFFNTGRIRNFHPSPWHYLFFVHTFLWAYLPWWPIFLAATWRFIKNFYLRKAELSEVFLFASFFITFILFSLTVFQVDHYTNILFPFASIICANYLYTAKPKVLKYIYWIELFISVVLLALVSYLTIKFFDAWWCYIILSLAFIVLLGYILLYNIGLAHKIVVFPSLAVVVLFVFISAFNSYKYINYDAPYNVSRYINNNNNKQSLGVVDYNLGWFTLNFYIKSPYIYVNNLNELHKYTESNIYLVAKQEDLKQVQSVLNKMIIVKYFYGTDIQSYMHQMIKDAGHINNLDKFVLIKVN